jgi:hypothetical protein
MSIERTREEHQRLRDIANYLKRRGYRVLVEPPSNSLPEFLRPFRPDLVAESEDESLVIEMTSRDRHSDPVYWRELTNAVEEHPGWRLELVLAPPPNGQRLPALSAAEIKDRLRSSALLTGQGQTNAAFLLNWSALEAAMRHVCDREELDPPDYRTATLISRLYTEGEMDREDYDRLMELMRQRNAIVHGMSAPPVEPDTVAELDRLSRELLEQPTPVSS